ncbi:MAG: hypothetical protein LBK60_02810, partial [Verrucomicrobiales bacterium]|nr:hypothetical protein [Verrucomicrobiales bacterium]
KLESRKQKAEIISVFSFRLAPVPTLNYPRAPRHPFTEGELLCAYYAPRQFYCSWDRTFLGLLFCRLLNMAA